MTVSERTRADARRAIAMATGEAYLAVIAGRRIVELNERARDTARAHYEYANQRFQGGLGSRLNALRAQEDLSGGGPRRRCAPGAAARSGIARCADGDHDRWTAPTNQCSSFPPDGISDAQLVRARQDVQVIASREAAALRVATDAWKDRLPEATAVVTPQLVTPAGLFADRRSWRAAFLVTVLLFDAGERQDAPANGRRLSMSRAPTAKTSSGRRHRKFAPRAKPSAPPSVPETTRGRPPSRRTRWCRLRTSRSAKARRRTSR